MASKMKMTWDQVLKHHSVKGMETTMGEVLRLYVSEACREQREICYTEARIDRDLGGDIYIIEDSIKNAPEPKML